MIASTRIKNAYRSYLSVEEAQQSDLYTEEEILALSFVFRGQNFIIERLMVMVFNTLEKLYENGARTKADYTRTLNNLGDDPEVAKLTAEAYSSVLDGKFSVNMVRMYICENFDSIFSEEGFNAVSEETNVRRRH